MGGGGAAGAEPRAAAVSDSQALSSRAARPRAALCKHMVKVNKVHFTGTQKGQSLPSFPGVGASPRSRSASLSDLHRPPGTVASTSD